MPTINEIAQTVGFRGPSSRRVAEPNRVRQPVIDNAGLSKRKVTTSVDAYVSGKYVMRDGRSLEVIQRYTIIVSYTAASQQRTLEQIRQRIMDDFTSKYGTLNISTVYIRDLPAAPVVQPAQDTEFYTGSEEWKRTIKRASFDIQTEREKMTRNVTSIKRKYGI